MMMTALGRGGSTEAEADAIRILDSHRVMAVATNRHDGWPQNTIVGYANIGLLIYFVVFRSSQKLANIKRDGRIAIAVGEEPAGLDALQAVYAGADTVEVSDKAEKEQAWNLLAQRHPNLAGLDLPGLADAAVMRAKCRYVSVLDYKKGFGHSANFEIM